MVSAQSLTNLLVARPNVPVPTLEMLASIISASSRDVIAFSVSKRKETGPFVDAHDQLGAWYIGQGFCGAMQNHNRP
jgi:hypothetical protein